MASNTLIYCIKHNTKRICRFKLIQASLTNTQKRKYINTPNDINGRIVAIVLCLGKSLTLKTILPINNSG